MKKRDVVVCKYGGSSVCDAEHFRNVSGDIKKDPARRYIVVSAPGKRFPTDAKITDLLLCCYKLESGRGFPGDQEKEFTDLLARFTVWQEPFQMVADRFREICADLGLTLNIEAELAEIEGKIPGQQSRHYAASRGEYLSAQLMASLLGWPFVDATSIIKFNDSGNLDKVVTLKEVSRILDRYARAVIPGFYGESDSGSIYTLERGGSDVTGTIVTKGVRADVYENCTDTNGVLAAPPKVVSEAHSIDRMINSELSELSAAGASVFHEEAVIWMRDCGAVINVRNTNNPDHPGTIIVPDEEDDPTVHTGNITGLAMRSGFAAITLQKARMNTQIGFIRDLAGVLASHQVNVEHIPSGKNTLSVVVSEAALRDKQVLVLSELTKVCQPEKISVLTGLTLIAVVGRGMKGVPGVAERVFQALREANINVELIDQGASELSIVIGVKDGDASTAMRAIYKKFFPS